MSESQKPNVVLIVADDMGYGDFGAFSEGRVRTPALDRLVQEGVIRDSNPMHEASRNS